MMQGDLFNPQCETRNAQPDNKPVECLGLTFPNDEERRKYFLKKLREGLEELHAKLGGVPFTTVEDAMKRMKSVEKWPLPATTHAAQAGLVLLDNIEILFDVHLKQDPLRLLQGLSRNKTVVAAWNGSIVDGHMTYAVPDHPEYRRYPIRDFLVASPEVTT